MIIFSYKISDFIANTQILSIYRASSAYNAGNEGVVYDTAISPEDESFMTKYLKAGASLVSQVISGYTKDLINKEGDTVLMVGQPFEFDVIYEMIEHSIVFRVNMPETFNQSVMPALDEAIKDALENYTLYRTAKLRAVEFASYQEDWETALGQVRTFIHRRTEGTRRSYKFI
jgi:hypothetical protein